MSENINAIKLLLSGLALIFVTVSQAEVRRFDVVSIESPAFDPARDIKAITVNRWPHGYTVGTDAENDKMHWFSDPWPNEKKIWLKGRKQFGRIAIANSDAAASAMTESAIEQGYRAMQEVLNDS